MADHHHHHQQRELDVTVISAQDLKNVNTFGKMSPYAEVWIHSGSNVSRKAETPVHTHGGVNPSWNALVKLVCDESLLEPGSQGVLNIEILNHGSALSLKDKEIGSVSVPLSQVVPRDDKYSNQAKSMSFQVQKLSGGVQGVLHISVKLGNLIGPRVATTHSTSTSAGMESKTYNSNMPTAPYPPAGYSPTTTSSQYQYPPQYAPQVAQGQYASQGRLSPQYPPSQYPPQGQFPPQYAPSQYGQPQYAAAPQYPPQYAPPPQGYYPQQPYAQPVQVVQQPARSGFGGGGGLGLGAGLLGGAVGGLVLGEVLGDIGDRNDGGGCGGGGCGGGGCGGGCGGN